MTVYIEKPAVNLREELASLRNQGGYSEQQFYFDGLVTNGDFASNVTGWTALGGGSTIVYSAGTAAVTSAGVYGAAYQSFTTVVGKTYIITWDVTAGSGRLRAGTYANASNYANDVDNISTGNTKVLVSTTTTTFITLGTNSATATANFDNVSVFEVDANNDVIHTMPKGWVPKDFFEDGLLQREGAAHDYTVVYDGFDYYVKPTVAPSATTQTCVIGVKA